MSFLCKNGRPSVVSTKRRVDEFFSTKCRVDEVTVDEVSCTAVLSNGVKLEGEIALFVCIDKWRRAARVMHVLTVV